MTNSSRNSSPPPLPLRMEGKHVVITGVNDGGIGGAIAQRLAREGARLSMLSLEPPAKILKRFERRGTEAELILCDVAQPDQVEQAVDQLVQRFGQVDALINNAGIDLYGAAEQITDVQWAKIFEVNMTGAMRVTRSLLPHFHDQGGAIVNLASVLALGGSAGFTAYSATKAGLIGWSQSLAWELAPRKIRVNCLAPALVATPMAMKHAESLTDEARAQIEASHPLGVGRPQDVAAAVAFMASDDSRWITGTTLPLGWASGFSLPAIT